MSYFRSLAPSHEHDLSSGLSSGPSSGPSPPMPAGLAGKSSANNITGGGAGGATATAAGGGTGPGRGLGGDGGRKRRKNRNVSAIACTECRHARQKVRGITFH